jgi:curved DNA-binding protein
MDFIDYYKNLGLTKKTSVAEIKAAYKKLARKYHPDLNPNDKNAKANLLDLFVYRINGFFRHRKSTSKPF